MPNQHIRDYIKIYTMSQRSPGYAILIDGPWGIGKTHLIRTTLDSINEESDAFKYVSVSLYGISKFEDIEARIFQALNPRLSSKKFVLAKSLFKGAIKATTKVNIDGDDSPDGTLSLTVPSIDLTKYMVNTEGFVLVFDDLERCALPINEILGYLNYFVEIDGYKMIIAANQDKITSTAEQQTSESGQLHSYEYIKEKLIGKTFKVSPEIDIAFNIFVNNISDGFPSEVVKRHKKNVISIFECSKCSNLRILERSMVDFTDLFKCLNTKIRDHDECMEALIHYYFVFYFEVLGNNSEEDSLSSISNSLIHSHNEARHKELSRKYGNLYWERYFLDFKLIGDWVIRGKLNEKDINSSILASRFFINNESADWMQLWYYHQLKDSPFQDLVPKVIGNLEQRHYKSMPVLLHVCSTLLDISKNKLYPINVDDILGLGKCRISEILEAEDLKGLMKVRPIEGSYNQTGYQYHANGSKPFEVLKDFIQDKTSELINSMMPNEAKSILMLMKDDFSHFSGEVDNSFGLEGIYTDRIIFNYMDIKVFLAAVKELEPRNISLLSGIFENRYSASHRLHALRGEGDWLIALDKELDEEIKRLPNTLMEMHLKNLARGVASALDHFVPIPTC